MWPTGKPITLLHTVVVSCLIKVSTRSDYAIRVVIELVDIGPRTLAPLQQLASRTATPPKYLGVVLRALETRGIVHSVRGKQGGYRLGRSADQISLGEVIRLMDGPLAPLACASRTAYAPCPTTRCKAEGDCILHEVWLEVRDAISAVVDNITFADLAARRRISAVGN